MKKKIIGISVATFGVLLSIGGAIALYQQAAEDAGFGISAGTYAGSSGSVAYKINNQSGASNVAPSYLKTDGTNGGTALGNGYTQVYYEMALGAAFADGANAQDYVVGNLSVSVTNIPATYRGKLAIWACIDDYVAGSLGEHYYKNALMAEDFAISDAEGHDAFSAAADVAVSAAGTQKLHIYLKYTFADSELYGLDEAGLGYTLSVAWTEASNNFGRAYVKGTGNLWQEDDGYSMAPNINKAHAEGWEWVYNNLPGSFNEAKCFIPGATEEQAIWSAGDNAQLDGAKSYNVYWNGTAEGAANFSEIVVQP